MEPKKKKKKWWIVLIVLLVIGMFGNFSSDDGKAKTDKDQENETNWAAEYSVDDAIGVDSEVLYEYGEAYAGQVILTAVEIKEVQSNLIKVDTENNDSFFFSIVFDFHDSSEAHKYKKGDFVTIIGTVEEPSVGKSVSVMGCHVIASGEAAELKKSELSETIEQQIELAGNLRAVAREQKREKYKERLESYKIGCESVNYTDVQRYPDNYKDKQVKASGKVIQVAEGIFDSVTLRVQDYNGDIWYVTYSYKGGEAKILENDRITVYGKSTGTTTYKGLLGNSVTIPSISAEYIEF